MATTPQTPPKRHRRPVRRGAVNNRTPRGFIGAYFPEEMLLLIDAAVAATDTDRSKFLRAATTERLITLKLKPANA